MNSETKRQIHMKRRRRLIAPAAFLTAAVLSLTACSGTAADNDRETGEDLAATIDISGIGFAVEEVTDELVFPTAIAVAFDYTTYVIAGEEDDRYLVVWHPSTNEWRIVTSAEAGFSDPLGITVSDTGDVYVANSGNNTISVADRSIGDGQVNGDAPSSWRVLQDSSFNQPTSVAVGSAGEIAIINSGDASVSVSYDDGATWSVFDSELTGLVMPTAIDVTVDGTVIITDAALDSVALSSDGGASWRVFGTESGFSLPITVDSGPDGTIYVANYDNSSLSYSTDNGENWGIKHGFGEVAGLAVSPDGSLFVIDGVTSAARVSTTPGPVVNLRTQVVDGAVTVRWQHTPVSGGNAIIGYNVSLYAADGSDSDVLSELTGYVSAERNEYGFDAARIAAAGIAADELIAAVQSANENGLGGLALRQIGSNDRETGGQ